MGSPNKRWANITVRVPLSSDILLATVSLDIYSDRRIARHNIANNLTRIL